MFNIFDISLQLSGFPLKKAKKNLHHILSISENDFELYLENKKKEIVNYHLQNNSNYINFVGKSTFDNWSELPTKLM